MKQFIAEWKKKDLKSKLWMAGGVLFLLLAVVGLAIPIVPQIPFAIISAFCFSKGSARIHKRIRNHKRLGPPVRDWEDHRVVKPTVKALSGVAMLIGGALAWYQFHEEHQAVAFGIAAIFLCCIVFVLTRNSHASEDDRPVGQR